MKLISEKEQLQGKSDQHETDEQRVAEREKKTQLWLKFHLVDPVCVCGGQWFLASLGCFNLS